MAKGRRQNLKSCCDTVCRAEFLALFGRHGGTDFEGMGGLILKAWEE